MECNYRGISRTAIIKRRQNRIRQCRTLYPNDGFLDNISVNLHVHNQVDNIPLPGHGTLHEPEQMEIQEHSEIGREQDIEKNYQQNIENREDFTRGRDDLNDTFERNDDENKDEHDRRSQFFQSSNIACCPLIANPQWSSKDHLFYILAMSVRFNFSYDCTLCMLKYAKKSHKSNNLPTTKKQLWKTLWRDKKAVIYHLYCKQCGGYICEGRIPTKRIAHV
ncbi:hypothetical protein PV325_011320 [Microctonus aethiopoides]|uniref:Uncharacterized protein n=1 Tax=Microctonus aethiopoides TaxID=144406 RepID=A0AA39C9H3_9HYME|nr:hypothetical protein PV325_011320 [Microctonus aethiopoides]KAK0160278.1 hypothetical protein PV328_007706 [Microctonus aethiopoides]